MRLILFDIDGTLTLTNEVDNHCYVCALGEALGTREIDTNWTNYPDVTDSGIATAAWQTRYGSAPSPEQLAAICKRFVALLEQAFAQSSAACRAVPGAAATLAALSERSEFAVGLATGGWLESAQLKLQRAGLAERSFPLASATDASARETIMALAAQRVATSWGIPNFQSIVYVGDAVWDVRAARNLGYHFIGIASGEREARLRREGAQHVLADYSDPSAFFEAISRF